MRNIKKILFSIVMIFFVCTVFIIPALSDSSVNMSWSKNFGGNDYDSAWQLIKTSDDGFVIVGTYEYYGSEERDAWLSKTNEDGTELWNTKIGNSVTLEDGYSVYERSNGDLVICGTTSEGEEDYSLDGFIYRTDSGGGGGFKYTFGGNDQNDYLTKIIESNDGHLVTVGNKNGNLWLLKVEPTWCNKDWERLFTDAKHGYDLHQTSDNGFIIVGIDQSNHICLIKTDDSGNEEWTKTLTSSGTQYSMALDITYDGGYIVSGWSSSSGNKDDFDVILIKTDSNGNIEWQQTFGGSKYEDVYDLIETSDRGFILACNSESYEEGQKIPLLIKTDSNGNKEWEKTFGGQSYDFISSIVQDDNGDYYVAGNTGEYTNKPYQDIWLLKFSESSSEIFYKPTITIDTPNDNQEVSGTIRISGTASDDERLSYSIIQIDTDHWFRPSGTSESWYWDLDTTELSNGMHTISAKSYDGEYYSEVKSVGIIVQNEVVTVENEIPTIGFIYPNADGYPVNPNSKLYIKGEADDPENNIEKIELKFDNDEWFEVTNISKKSATTYSFYLNYDIPNVSTGTHSLKARCYDGSAFSNISTRLINVKLKTSTEESSPSSSTPGFEILLVLLAIIVSILYLRKENKK